MILLYYYLSVFFYLLSTLAIILSVLCIVSFLYVCDKYNKIKEFLESKGFEPDKTYEEVIKITNEKKELGYISNYEFKYINKIATENIEIEKKVKKGFKILIALVVVIISILPIKKYIYITHVARIENIATQDRHTYSINNDSN